MPLIPLAADLPVAAQHVLLSSPLPNPPEVGLPESVANYQCDQNADLCHLVDQFTDADWVLAVSDLFVAKGLTILFIILIALVARRLLRRWIDGFTTKAASGTVPQRFRWRDRDVETNVEGSNVLLNERRKQRAETMASVLRSISTAVIFTVAFVMVLDEFGVSVGPIIASAGIIGVAVGFGAQTLVKDFLSGIFMLIEDQYGVGDVVDTGEATGAVEAVGLRVTRLRDIYGVVWYVRNGEVLRIGNHSQGWARAVVDVPAPYTEEIGRMRELLKEIAVEMWRDEEWNELILDEPEVWGLEALAADSMVVRVVFKTAPLKQWAVGREARQRVKDRFDREGIEIPFPQRMVWLRQDGTGNPRTGEGLAQQPTDDGGQVSHSSSRASGDGGRQP